MSLLKTENLVIVFTDIAGFTETTSLQSREQNQRILERHNSLLLPIVRRFRGRHIKSIGDALLLVFTSPTDGMRCAMAMQDAMHEYNLKAPEGEQIHIRVAASLGEVRVTKNDIFGEPVNVTSRIEGITPADEIYFSEAVYLAMNKAEVPALEVGLHELKGIAKPVRIYAIPRFAQSRLVPEQPVEVPVDPRVSFPYGGMHLSQSPAKASWIQVARLPEWFTAYRLGMGLFLVGACTLAVWAWNVMRGGQSRSQDVAPTPTPIVVTATPTPLSTVTPTAIPSLRPTLAALRTPFSLPLLRGLGLFPTASRTPTPLVRTSAAVAPTSTSAARPTAVPTEVYPTPLPQYRVVPRHPKVQPISTILAAKEAYRAGRIDKATYRKIVEQLETQLDERVRQTKLDYRDGKFSKDEYRRRIIALKLRYIGEE